MNQMLLGLDFGTCYSSAALTIDNIPKPIKEPINRGYSFPSSVFITNQEQILIGQAAENSRQKDPQRYRREFKRDLGSPNPYNVGNTARLPEELATEVIRKLKTEAEKVVRGLGEKALTNAVLTIPATYQPFKRQLMEQAGLQAGFNKIELLEEPVAAAYYYSRQAKVAAGNIILVYDLGGGTFDATLIQKQGTGYQVLGVPRGLSHCGGTDFDRQIYQGLKSKCSPQLREQLSAREGWLARAIVTESCRDLKHQLSQQEEATIYIPMGLNAVEPYSLSRREFNGIIAPLIAETIECCDRLVSTVGLEWQQIDRVLLVGGSCRIPYIQQEIERKFQRQALLVDEPELAVCLGAAIKGINRPQASRVTVIPPQPQKTETTAEELYQQALQLLSQTPHNPNGIALLSQAIELKPDCAEAFASRGEIRLQLGDKPGAESDLYQAAQIYFSRQDFTQYRQAIDKIQAIHHPEAKKTVKTVESEEIPENSIPNNPSDRHSNTIADLQRRAQDFLAQQDFTQYNRAVDKLQQLYRSHNQPPVVEVPQNTPVETVVDPANSLKNYLNQKKQDLTAKNFTWQEEVEVAEFSLDAVAKGKQNIVLSFDAYFMFAAFENIDLPTLRYFALECLDYGRSSRTREIFSGTACYCVAIVEEADPKLIAALIKEPLHKEEGLAHTDYVLPGIFSLKDNALYISEKVPFFDPIGWTAMRRNARQILA